MSSDIYAIKQITDNPIKLHFTNCNYLGEIHEELKQKFGFHELYGANWDALFDLMRDVFSGNKEYRVEIYGYYSMKKDLQNECKTMLSVFDSIHNEKPGFTYKIID